MTKIKSRVGPTTIRSIGELIDHLMEYDTHKGRILWYRGHRSAIWDVDPTIWRDYTAEDERNFTHRFRSRAAIRMSSAPGYGDLAHWIALMRHYGLPTRLMDWSRSPLVALYFAVSYLLDRKNHELEDAVVWMLDPHLLNQIEDFPDIGRLTPSINSSMCAPMIAGAFYGDAAEPDKVLAVMAHDVDMRIFVQQGCFTIHSSRVPLNFREDHEEFLWPLRIPAENITTMANQIFTAGFRRGDIYPDLSNVALELVETFT
jgi:hypothetical protein